MSETKNRKELQREYSKAGTGNRSIAKAPHGMPGGKNSGSNPEAPPTLFL